MIEVSYDNIKNIVSNDNNTKVNLYFKSKVDIYDGLTIDIENSSVSRLREILSNLIEK